MYEIEREEVTAYKSPEKYEAEATWVGRCLVHPMKCVARIVYQKRHGDLPRDIYVCHTCDVSGCILDEHHFLGTQADNMRDASKKGRLRRSDATKLKLRNLQLGRKRSAEAKMRMRLAATGRKASFTARVNMSAAQRGRVMRPESRAKLSAAIMGHVVSETTRQKISDSSEWIRMERIERRILESVERMRARAA